MCIYNKRGTLSGPASQSVVRIIIITINKYTSVKRSLYNFYRVFWIRSFTLPKIILQGVLDPPKNIFTWCSEPSQKLQGVLDPPIHSSKNIFTGCFGPSPKYRVSWIHLFTLPKNFYRVFWIRPLLPLQKG